MRIATGLGLVALLAALWVQPMFAQEGPAEAVRWMTDYKDAIAAAAKAKKHLFIEFTAIS